MVRNALFGTFDLHFLKTISDTKISLPDLDTATENLREMIHRINVADLMSTCVMDILMRNVPRKLAIYRVYEIIRTHFAPRAS